MTVRSDVLVFVLVYATGETYDSDPTTFLPALRKLLADPAGLIKFGATLRVISAVDHVLPRAVTKIRESPRMIREFQKAFPGQPDLESIKLSQPLRRKHFEHALAAWKQLRETALAHRSLVDFEDRCLSS